MLARRLTIWFLVFVTSGLLWLAVPRNGHSEEICTTLNCVSRVKRKVEQQMRQQEMMRSGGSKSRRARGSQSGKIRIRYLSGKSETNKLKSRGGRVTNKITSLNLFYNSIGIGFSNYKNEGCYLNQDGGIYTQCDNGLTDKPYQKGNVSVMSLLYNFGDEIFFTIGANLYAIGEITYLDDSGSEITLKNPDKLLENSPLFQIGFRISNIEIILEADYTTVPFERPDETNSNNLVETNGAYLFGIGIVF